eukprot:jgi/Ulvmu1/4415/UM002_0140.1
MEFSRSACCAAQSGNTARLNKILSTRPHELHEDGAGGHSGYTPLHYAARAGHVNACKLLLQHGASVNAKTTLGRASSLHRAAFAGHINVVKLLVEHGADLCARDADGETALHKAARQGHSDVVELLLREDASAAKMLDKHGFPPMCVQNINHSAQQGDDRGIFNTDSG